MGRPRLLATRTARRTESVQRRLSETHLRLLLRRCLGHFVAYCTACKRAYTITELRARLAAGRADACPGCEGDLAPSLLDHLTRCRDINPPIA
jgi:NAD-dependent SIR2 family protein deacetylase